MTNQKREISVKREHPLSRRRNMYVYVLGKYVFNSDYDHQFFFPLIYILENECKILDHTC